MPAWSTAPRSRIDRGKIVTTFAMGTRRLYDYVDNNPLFSFNPTEYVNDPFVIGQQNKMVAINTALEVDLTGQVCADSLGTSFYSGIGGQADFNQGAGRSAGGRAIIALPSTADGGQVVAHRRDPQAGRRRRDHSGRRPLRGDGIRHRVSPWQERAGTGHGADHHRPPRFP